MPCQQHRVALLSSLASHAAWNFLHSTLYYIVQGGKDEIDFIDLNDAIDTLYD
jgi:hypothetical protein